MKKVIILSIYCLMYCCSSAQVKLNFNKGLEEAERAGKLNIITENKTGELLSTDPLLGKLHYKTFPFTLKKGMGALFFMQSNSFTPLIFLMTPQGKDFGTPGSKNIKDGLEATISYIAESDTSFYVVLSTSQENKTGPFTYGFKILNPDQMIFRKDMNTYHKLDYLINHWQLNWEFIPTTKESQKVNDEYKTTDHTMTGVGLATLMGGYQEKIYTGRVDTSDVMAKFHYDKFCSIIEAFISPIVWSTQTEKKETTGLISTTQYITHFFLKGAKPDEQKKSFKMVRKVQWTVLRDVEVVDVLLIFN